MCAGSTGFKVRDGAEWVCVIVGSLGDEGGWIIGIEKV